MGRYHSGRETAGHSSWPRSSMLRESPNSSVTLDSYLGVFRYSRRAVELVWSTDKRLTVALADRREFEAQVLRSCHRKLADWR